MEVDEHGRTKFLQAISRNNFEEFSDALDKVSCAFDNTASDCVLINRDGHGTWKPVVDN